MCSFAFLLFLPKVSNTVCVFETQRSIWPDECEGIWAGVLFFAGATGFG